MYPSVQAPAGGVRGRLPCCVGSPGSSARIVALLFPYVANRNVQRRVCTLHVPLGDWPRAG
jgi:hypothetical protein